MAKSEKTKGNKADKKAKKGKGKKGGDAGSGVSVAAHPRAAAQVRRAKGFGGLVFFVLVAYLSHQASVPPDQVALRALAGGIAGYLLAWACSVTVWRHLVLAEIKAAIEKGQATLEPVPAASPTPSPDEG